MPEKTPLSSADVLADIQARLHAPKGQMNSFGGYRYRSCEDILMALKPLLAEHNAAVVLVDTVMAVGDRIYVRAEATLRVNNAMIASSFGWAREAEVKKGMDPSQITGAASSYARKYALNGLFAIDDTQDSDATNSHGKGEDKGATPDPVAEVSRGDVDKLFGQLEKAAHQGANILQGAWKSLTQAQRQAIGRQGLEQLKKQCPQPGGEA